MSIKTIMRQVLLVTLCQSLIYTPVFAAGQLSLPSSDLIAPEVVHSPDTSPVPEGASKTIRAKVTDNVGIQSVTLFYRTKGDSSYNRRSMTKVDETNDYTATIDDVVSPGVEYYIQATDTAGNTLLNGYEFSPLLISVKSDDGAEKGAVGATAAIPGADTETTPSSATAAPETTQAKEEKGGINWLYVGLGVLAVGALASGGGGGGGGGDDEGKTTTVNIGAPAP